jgi:hypothetical protein
MEGVEVVVVDVDVDVDVVLVVEPGGSVVSGGGGGESGVEGGGVGVSVSSCVVDVVDVSGGRGVVVSGSGSGVLVGSSDVSAEVDDGVGWASGVAVTVVVCCFVGVSDELGARVLVVWSGVSMVGRVVDDGWIPLHWLLETVTSSRSTVNFERNIPCPLVTRMR